MIDLDRLQVSFATEHGSVLAVDGVSLHVAAGESYGIVGESGSGKSTILRALSGLNRTWEGTMMVDGVVLPRVRERSFYKRVQMVFQDPYGTLHPRHTVHRILAEPVAIHGLGDREARIERVLDSVGLPRGFRYRFPHQLSGGQRQRVAIARALILEPRVLLLDEPTSALDVSVQAEILNLLARLRAELGLTYMLVSHNLAVVAHMCDRIAVMRSGRFVEEVPVAQLREGTSAQPYTRTLLQSARGYAAAAA